ncbi:hypothetical protein B8A32_04160 [Loigolactobacillus backii]|uniref:Uncharacterized protein n=1 Tax=Pediococcus damnosus TaxID=51663 RepID=A0AAC9B3I0_9LACO|nr:hypothetical protein [Pediococcus damnosus]AMV63726.1 Hypothetical protein ADU70_0202 [Pediococcus damnosus]PIO86402.1 hypothetical protein B8A32_04160 [Loigolactobacillus backii]
MFWRLNRSTKRTDVLFYFSDFQNRQKTGISYSPIPESVDPKEDKGSGISKSDVLALQKRLKQLESENDILKKALTIFAKK